MKLFIVALFLPVFIFSQKVKRDTVLCDCAKARNINLKSNTRIGPTIAPNGFGEKQEIKEVFQQSKFTFEKEHNSAWYKLNIGVDGNLGLEIVPLKADDDYDFMIFKSTGKRFCDSFLLNRTKPIRACISRSKAELKGFTGLSIKGKKELVKEGPGDAFVQDIEVKKGEIYYLVLDNVYDNGDGHIINFFFEEKRILSGQILSDAFKPLQTEITITNIAGDTVEKTKTNNEGYYAVEAALKRTQKYSINFYNDETFFTSKEFTTTTPVDSLRNIKTILPKLKKGGKYIIKNINFYGGLATILPASQPYVRNLYKLMKKNSSLKILIVGHTNGCSGTSQKLSEDRPITVKTYLTLNGIDEKRVSTEGKNCSEMLYSDTGPEWQQMLNRRVEVKVIEFD